MMNGFPIPCRILDGDFIRKALIVGFVDVYAIVLFENGRIDVTSTSHVIVDGAADMFNRYEWLDGED